MVYLFTFPSFSSYPHHLPSPPLPSHRRWSGNLTCRYRDRTPDRVRRAAKDPVSYLNRNVPKRMTKSVSADVLRTTKSMADLLNATSGEVKEGFAKKFEENEEEEVRTMIGWLDYKWRIGVHLNS